MKKIQIITDTNCDISKDIELKHVTKIPAYFGFSGDDRVYEDGLNYNKKQFYGLLECGVLLDSYSIKPKTLRMEIEKCIEGNMDVICIHSSSSLFPEIGRDFDLVVDFMKTENPSANIVSIDSANFSVGLGLLIHKIDSMIETGVPFEAIMDYINKYSHLYNIAFTNSRLDTYKDINEYTFLKTTNKYPIFEMDKNGFIKVNCCKKQKEPIVSSLLKKCSKYESTTDIVNIVHANNISLAHELSDEIKAKYPDKDIYISGTSCLNASILKPKTLGISLLKK